MAATFISVTLEDFARRFKAEKGWTLVQLPGKEAFFQYIKVQNAMGSLVVRVYTSVAEGRKTARGCGEDAIRVCTVWLDEAGWDCGVTKERRVNRCGGEGATAADVVDRTVDRVIDTLRKTSIKACPKCGRPMTLRTKRATGMEFWGCVGYGERRANCNGTRPETFCQV